MERNRSDWSGRGGAELKQRVGLGLERYLAGPGGGAGETHRLDLPEGRGRSEVLKEAGRAANVCWLHEEKGGGAR